MAGGGRVVLPGVHRVVPDPGLTQGPTRTEFTERQQGVELRLTPLGAYRLFGLPMSELTDRVVDLDALWGPAASRLAERLAEAPGWAERFALLDGELTSLAERGRTPDPELEAAWRRLEDSAGRLRIGELQADTGWSRRRLADRFRQQLGLTPKALACGYYDQAHLNREFRALAGCTPTDYVRGAVTNVQDFGAGPS
jgi:AraC-like DNA-binding protein